MESFRAFRFRSLPMADLKELQKRYNDAYLGDWLPEHQEMKIVQDLMVDYLMESEKQIARMMDYHREIFFQQFPLVQRYGIPEDAQLSITPSSVADAIRIEEQESFLLQEDPLITFQSQGTYSFSPQEFDAVYVLDHTQHTVASYQAPFQNIRLQQAGEPIISTWKLAFSAVFSTQEQVCELKITCQDAQQTSELYQFLAACDCSFYNEETYVGECQLEVIDQQIDLILPKHDEIISTGCFLFSFDTVIPECCITAITLHFIDLTCLPSQVLVQEKECDSKEFALFDMPLELYQEAYIRCDEAFSKARTEIKLTGHIRLQEELAGKEFLIEAEYRPIMRSLPKKQMIYETYADQVQLQYFHGEWSKLPKVQWEDAMWKQDGSFTISFVCPTDIEPVDIEGETGYWLRFVLLKAENCYLMPCHHHIPIIQLLQIQIAQREQGYPVIDVRLTDVDGEHELIKQLQQEGRIVIHKQEKKEGVQLYFHLEQLLHPSHPIYIEMETNYHHSQGMSCWYDSFTGKRALPVHDETEGLSKSGGLSITCPKDMCQTNYFGRQGYWVILQLADSSQTNTIQFVKERYLTARMQDQEVKDYELPTQFPLTIEMNHLDEIWVKEEETFVKWEIYPRLDQQLRHVAYEEDCGQLTIPITACQETIRKAKSITLRLVTHVQTDTRTLDTDVTLMPNQPHDDISQIELIQPISLYQPRQGKLAQQNRAAKRLYGTDQPYSLAGIKQLILHEFVDVEEVSYSKEQSLMIYIACPRIAIRPQLLAQIKQLLADRLPTAWISRIIVKEQMDIQVDIHILTTASKQRAMECCKAYLQTHVSMMGAYPDESDMRLTLATQLQDDQLALHMYGEAVIEDRIRRTSLAAFRVYPQGVLILRRINVIGR